VADFLNLEARVQFKDIQPTHLGQAFVRFKNVYDRDQLIGRGPMHFGDVTLTFVEHRKARNWRAVNFNRECWLLLLGFPPDYREDEYVVNAINSFGRVVYWVDDETHLARLLVRARVVDYESVPQFIVMTEGEGFQGESWTVQCEILQGELLGGSLLMRNQPQMIFLQGALMTSLDLGSRDQAQCFTLDLRIMKVAQTVARIRTSRLQVVLGVTRWTKRRAGIFGLGKYSPTCPLTSMSLPCQRSISI
jgi:hypothetical protein